MAPRRWMQADSVRFLFTGRGAQGLLARAAGQGVRLWAVRCAGGGYAASAAGRDWPRLQAVAAAGGWQLTLLRRQGPGRWWEKLWRRPGVPVGAALFLVLCAWLPGFVWQLDFGTLPVSARPAVRSLLAEQGIWEGGYLCTEQMQRAQAALEREMPDFGWVSLQFTGGCLRAEYTARERQAVQAEPEPAALYAKAAGQVTAIELRSGFPSVTAGQYVAAGQLLANGQKANREGEPVEQPASGRILAVVQQQYQAEIPLRQTATALTGCAQTSRTLHLFGLDFEFDPGGREAAAIHGQARESWQPLTLGRVSLPACLYTRTVWEETEQTFPLSADAARALAHRACRLQLAAEFPDADEVQEQVTFSQQEEGIVRCTVQYQFVADIAKPGKVAPLAAETTQ